jgi:hypothetical protein
MVSYPDDSGIEMSSTLSAPFRSSRAPSVASTSARTSNTIRASRHQHRQTYSKSHAGVTTHSSNSSNHAPVNEFPTFDRTGDVEIVIASGRKESRYVLHKLYLAQCSGWFEDVLDIGEGEETPGPTSRSSNRTGNRIRFELDRGKTDEPLPMLILKVRPVLRQVQVQNQRFNCVLAVCITTFRGPWTRSTSTFETPSSKQWLLSKHVQLLCLTHYKSPS